MDVFNVEGDAPFERWIAPRCDLPQSCHAGDGVEPLQVLKLVALHVVRGMRAWPDQTHVSEQDIPELRKFIQAIAPKPVPQTRDPRITLDFEECSLSLIAQSELVLDTVRFRHHRAELVAEENAPFVSNS